MSSELKADLIKDKSGTKTLATLSSSAVTLSNDVTQTDAYYVQGKINAAGDIGSDPKMLNLNGTTAPYINWTGQTTSFGDGSSKVTGTNDYDFKFIQKGIYFVSFSLSGEAVTSNRHELIECQIRGGSSSHSTTTLARAVDGIQNSDDATSDYGGCTATLVRQFNANDLINFLVDSDQYANFKLMASTHISIFLIRALA